MNGPVTRRPTRLTRLPRLLVAVAVAGAVLFVPVALALSQDGPARPAVVDQQVRDVMSRAEFSYEPSIMERIGEWISDLLDDLFPETTASGSGTAFAGGVGPLFAWVLILLAVAAAIAVVVVVLRNRVPRVRDEEPPTEAEIEHRRRADEWLADAERLEADGNWKDALRARYRNLVRTLVDRRQLPDVPGRTTGELRADLARTTPSAQEAFDTCSLLFELPWYADVPTGPEENRRFRDAAALVLSASPEDRFDPVMLLDVAGVSREPMVSEGGVVETSS